MERKTNCRKPVLLIVDVQNGVVSSAYNREPVINNIKLLIQKARDKNVPIIWVQHSDDELKINSNEWEIVQELKRETVDYRIDKHFNSSFEETTLERILTENEITEIALVGAQTNWCIRATAYGSLERGYDLSVISDAHTTESIDLGNGTILEAKSIIADLNITMSWLSYPGRKNRAQKTKEYEF